MRIMLKVSCQVVSVQCSLMLEVGGPRGPGLVSASGIGTSLLPPLLARLVYLLDFRLHHDSQWGTLSLFVITQTPSRDLMESIRH